MIKAGIVGATGYGGLELIRLLLSHSEVEIVALAAKMEDKSARIGDLFPHLAGRLDLVCSNLNMEEMAKECDLIFLAVPHKVSLEIAPVFINLNKKVIDFSADYRFDDLSIYEKWYGVKHTHKALSKEAVYGLPELYRERIRKAYLLANPGCYATSVILGLAPLIADNLVDRKSIIADSKSGVSGAGRWPGEGFNFSEVQENFKAYKVASHRHQPEIEQELSKLAGEELRVTFVPHLLPVQRGILSTIYASLVKEMGDEDLLEVYTNFYGDEPFVRILAPDELPETGNVCGSNYCQIGLKVDKGTNRAIIVSALDNLVKGASGQAIQNMNIMCGLEEKEGLDYPGLMP